MAHPSLDPSYYTILADAFSYQSHQHTTYWHTIEQQRTRMLPLLILGWYFCSITLSLYNKWMFDPYRGLRVPCPILITSFHQLLLWLLSWLYLKYTKPPPSDHERNSAGNDERVTGVASAETNSEIHTRSFYWKYIVPTAVASAGDIGFGNVSFKFIPLTIYTIVKSSSIAFVLLFSCLLRLEKFHWKLMAIVAIMFTGVVMMVYQPERADQSKDGFSDSDLVFGFFLVLASACLSGLRWVYTQLILHANAGVTNGTRARLPTDDHTAVRAAPKKNPIHTIHQLAPIMGVVLFTTSLIIENPFPQIFHTNLFRLDDKVTGPSLLKGTLLLLFPGIQVFLMTICEFGILQTAQVLTLSIAGIVKELLTILVSMIVLGERLSGFYNWIGMCIVLLDVCYYNYYRYMQEFGPYYRNEYDIEEEMTTAIQDFEMESVPPK